MTGAPITSAGRRFSPLGLGALFSRIQKKPGKIGWRIRFAVFGQIHNHSIRIALFEHFRSTRQQFNRAIALSCRRTKRPSPLDNESHAT